MSMSAEIPQMNVRSVHSESLFGGIRKSSNGRAAAGAAKTHNPSFP